MIYGAGQYIKHYIAVLALFRLDGGVLPVEILWDDGRRFSVEVITDGKRTRCDKTPGYALCFTVRIHGVTRHLYRDNVGWFVETYEGSPVGKNWDPRLNACPE